LRNAFRFHPHCASDQDLVALRFRSDVNARPKVVTFPVEHVAAMHTASHRRKLRFAGRAKFDLDCARNRRPRFGEDRHERVAYLLHNASVPVAHRLVDELREALEDAGRHLVSHRLSERGEP